MLSTKEIILKELRNAEFVPMKHLTLATGISSSRVRSTVTGLRFEGFNITHELGVGYKLHGKESTNQMRTETHADTLRQIFKHGDEWSLVELSEITDRTTDQVSKSLNSMQAQGEPFLKRKDKEKNTTIWWLETEK